MQWTIYIYNQPNDNMAIVFEAKLKAVVIDNLAGVKKVTHFQTLFWTPEYYPCLKPRLIFDLKHG